MWTLQDICVDEIETHASIIASEAIKVYADMSIMKVLINLCRIAMFYEKDYPNRSEALNKAIDLLGDEYTMEDTAGYEYFPHTSNFKEVT